MKPALAIVSLTQALTAVCVAGVLLAGCGPSGPATSEWSTPSNGLQLQIESATEYARKEGFADIDATCTIRTSATSPASILHLARLYLVDGAGVTKWCQRYEDVSDAMPARPDVPPGGATSWTQDGRIQTGPGVYHLFAEWDGNPKLRSPPVKITIE